MSRPKWTQAHQREALRSIFEIAAELASDGDREQCFTLAGEDVEGYRREAHFRRSLAYAGLDAMRIAREVRRVRARAEHRVVTTVKVHWRVRFRDGGPEDFDDLITATQRHAQWPGSKLLRVTTTTHIMKAWR